MSSLGTTVSLQTNTKYNSNTQTQQMQWWWFVVPIGVILLCFFITLGLEFHWAPNKGQSAGFSGFLTAPIHYTLKGTQYVGQKIIDGTSYAGTMLFETAGQAVSGPFNMASAIQS
jgi:hypothetical protein